MNWLPRASELGDLFMEETFVFFDGPRVFTCRSITDQLYLAAWAEETDRTDVWLYVPISTSRLALFRSGGYPLRAAFQDVETALYEVTIDVDEEQADIVRRIDPAEVPDWWLPQKDFRLNLPTFTAVPAETPSEIVRKVQQENRTRFRIKLVHPSSRRTEAPTKQVGEILILAQKLYDNVGFSLESPNVSQVGRIPLETAKKTASDVVALSAASFVIEIAANSFDDLFGDSLFADATKTILQLVDPQLQTESISKELVDLGPRAAKSFRRFVRGLADSESDVTLAAAGTNFDYINHHLPMERLDLLVRILNRLVPDEDVVEIRERMELVAFDSARRTFGLEDKEGTKYEGKVDDRATAQSSHPTIHDQYDVLISAVSVLDEVVGEVRVSYTLSQLLAVVNEEQQGADNPVPGGRGGAGVDEPGDPTNGT